MRNEQLIYLSFAAHNIIARNTTHDISEIGDQYFIQLKQGSVIYFEPSSGMIME